MLLYLLNKIDEAYKKKATDPKMYVSLAIQENKRQAKLMLPAGKREYRRDHVQNGSVILFRELFSNCYRAVILQICCE